MLRIRVPKELASTGCDPRNFFDLNGQPYGIVQDDGPVDILVLLPWQRVDQSVEIKRQWAHTISIELDIWHGFENGIAHMTEHCRQNKLPYADNHYLITHIEQDSSVSSQNIIYTEHCFNKAKSNYTHFPYHPQWIPTDWNGPYTCIMPRLNGRSHRKIFLATNRIDTARADHQVRARFAIHKLIQSGYTDRGYTSDGTHYLHAHSSYPLIDNVDFLDMQPKPSIPFFGQGVHNLYYQDTFVSIYGETIEYGTGYVVTEKTYNPLAKGHFILPFSAPRFLDLVTAKGFVLPDFIDYSYDQIEDFDARLDAYIKEAQRLMQISIEQWQELYQKNIDLLYHNQLVFHRRPYQCVDIAEIVSNQK